MEDVLRVYERPYDPAAPVVCIDEMNRQLIEETRLTCEPGHPEKVDSEYVRKGMLDVFTRSSHKFSIKLQSRNCSKIVVIM